MTILQVAEIMVVGWFIIELFRRIILFAYHEWTKPDYPTLTQYQAWKDDLRKRNG